MERRKLILLLVGVCLVAAVGCGQSAPEPVKPAEPVKLPPGMKLGYQPPKK